ncbi:unnamed protein product [Sordaria macrospora k-hell]|uniref:WGS project CABT00000000 data, contig 2.34 n=1 Tax=Sordaria macrospora (strain ATCC MYA-333 / DSM 997 / K(L3346) / K-hell) TaxID=771870 RepID=F7W6G2_SORMK|nr:uncharacterized protein SMAC_06319 [Sordaria macrospora k-hell]CCC13101.1 unnamed protein product [Sordaria macrospora k-hell]
MAPPKPQLMPEHTVDRTPEYEKFIEELRAFHEKRGTNFDPEPKMGNLTVDLLKLFKHIVEHGGYDKVSDEKLMWRKMCEGLGLMRHNAPADAYTLKQIFYKNLAAYEIKTVHNKEPPPPEILEFTTAKGGSLLTRTLENFTARSLKGDKEDSGDDGTPSRERSTVDTPNSARASRGLREAPAPRVIFHPDTNSTRQTRHAGSAQQQPAANPSSNSNSQNSQQPPSHSQSHSSTPIPSHGPPHAHQNRGSASVMYNPGPDHSHHLVQSFQPPPLQPLQLRIVDTPTSNPELFNKRRRLLRQPGTSSTSALVRAALPPGSLDGPNIYERCLLALRSGIRAEQAFGLNHLVKISFERGDKYKFAQFSGLAEGLTEFALGVGSLFYNVEWIISNDPDADDGDIGELDGINGTLDILERIAQLKPKDVQDNFQPSEFTDHMTLVTEAVLTIRNMVMLPDNAWFMADYAPIKDLLCILLHLPDMDLTVELKHFALDIAEQITPNLVLESDDPLYQTLLGQLKSNDRGTILTALRAIGRISMNHATETNKLHDVPVSVLQNLMDWLLLNDDELVDACLDFLYQYTAVVPNLDTLIKGTNVEHLVIHLVRLLSHGAKRYHKDIVVSEARIVYDPPSEQVVSIPPDLLERLLTMEEPERTHQWVRCTFEEDPDAQVTQIAIWQAYNAAFLEPLKRTGRSMINAAEFIRNISSVYHTAGNPASCFPISPENRGYLGCQWTRQPTSDEQQQQQQQHQHMVCGAWHLTTESMWNHILTQHLGEAPGTDNKFSNKEGTYSCHWDSCRRYPTPTKLNLMQLMMHIKTHLKAEEARHNALYPALQPPPTPAAGGPGGATEPFPGGPASGMTTPGGGPVQVAPSPKRSKTRVIKPASTISLTFEETASVRDERNPNVPPQAAGIPLSAVLILRNIARNVVKTDAEERLRKQSRKRLGDGQEEDDNDEAKEEEEEEGALVVVSTVPSYPGLVVSADAGWNERLFRPVMPRLWEVFCENRLLAPYITSLFKLLEPVE